MWRWPVEGAVLSTDSNPHGSDDARGLELVALAEAFERWPQQAEVFGHASDDTREVLVHGEMIDRVMVFYHPILIDTRSSTRT